MANRARDLSRERFWRGVLKRFRGSGLSVRAFCRREGVSEPSFYAWRRTIARRDRPSARPSSRSQRAIGFLPVRLTNAAPMREAAASLTESAAATITIELTDGMVLRLPESTSVQRLAELVYALEGRGER